MTRGRRKARRMRHVLPPALPVTDAQYAEQFQRIGESEALLIPAEAAKTTYPRQLTAEELTGGKDDTQLTAELAAALRRVPVCSHCGGRHTRACPRVRRMEFHPNGALASVEFWAEGRWNDSEIIWQEDLIDGD